MTWPPPDLAERIAAIRETEGFDPPPPPTWGPLPPCQCRDGPSPARRRAPRRRAEVLRLLGLCGTLRQVDLARMVGVSPTTVATILQEHQAAGLVARHGRWFALTLEGRRAWRRGTGWKEVRAS